MDRMTTYGDLSVRGYLKQLRANWPALLLPLMAVDMFGLLLHHNLSLLLLIVAVFLAALMPVISARIAPFALFAYGAYGLYLMHSLLIREHPPVLYGLVRVSQGIYTSGPLGLVLTEAVVFMAAGVWLLARPGAPGGGAVRRAIAQLRGTEGQPRTVPPLLLMPVLFLWEEMFCQPLGFGAAQGSPALAGVTCTVLILAVGAATVVWLPRAAAAIAVVGTVMLGLQGVLAGAQWVWDPGSAPVGPYSGDTIGFYGAVLLDGGISRAFAGLQGIALLGLGRVLGPRLLTWNADHQLARQAQALARRVEGLTRSRTDATETAVAELRRIERDLHDGAQARLVAVGMSLRAAEQLMIADPQAALALVTEARETSSRAIDDLRNLVRGIYPPVLADRGLADAVRALALDAVLDVDVHVDLPGEPPMPVAAAVYFAVAEALTNAARHAGACAVQVEVGYVDGMLRATVTDDGAGGADAGRGTGLAGVERRLATFDGILAVSSPVGGPTIIVIEVPCALSSAKISSY
jgi:signal transduction histidine kinase